MRIGRRDDCRLRNSRVPGVHASDLVPWFGEQPTRVVEALLDDLIRGEDLQEHGNRFRIAAALHELAGIDDPVTLERCDRAVAHSSTTTQSLNAETRRYVERRLFASPAATEALLELARTVTAVPAEAPYFARTLASAHALRDDSKNRLMLLGELVDAGDDAALEAVLAELTQGDGPHYDRATIVETLRRLDRGRADRVLMRSSWRNPMFASQLYCWLDDGSITAPGPFVTSFAERAAAGEAVDVAADGVYTELILP
jgi:hypothetical protein